MTGGTLVLGITFAALCVATGITIGWPIGNRRGWKHAAEEAAWRQQDARWKGLADAMDRPVPVRPPVPPTMPPEPPLPRPGAGKHRNPAGPPRHAERAAPLPVAGYLPAPGPWDGTLTLPAPAQAPPWDIPEPEPRTQVLEPTAVLSPDSLTDTAWTRRMADDMDRWIAEHIGATDSTLKAITK